MGFKLLGMSLVQAQLVSWGLQLYRCVGGGAHKKKKNFFLIMKGCHGVHVEVGLSSKCFYPQSHHWPRVEQLAVVEHGCNPSGHTDRKDPALRSPIFFTMHISILIVFNVINKLRGVLRLPWLGLKRLTCENTCLT